MASHSIFTEITSQPFSRKTMFHYFVTDVGAFFPIKASVELYDFPAAVPEKMTPRQCGLPVRASERINGTSADQ